MNTEREQKLPPLIKESYVGYLLGQLQLRLLPTNLFFDSYQRRFDKKGTTTSQKLAAIEQQEEREKVEVDEKSVSKVRYILQNIQDDAPKHIAKSLRLPGQAATTYELKETLYNSYGFRGTYPITNAEMQRIEQGLIENGYKREEYATQFSYSKDGVIVIAEKGFAGAVKEIKVSVIW